MKKLYNIALASALLLFGNYSNAQELKNDKPYNQLSVDFNVGTNKPLSPFTPGHRTSTIGFVSLNGGARYMLNNTFGLKADLSFDNMKSAPESMEFHSRLFRGTIQGVVNMGNLLDFSDFTENISMLFHGGFGVATLRNENSDGFFNVRSNRAAEMLTFVFGFTPQYKVNENLSVNMDWSLYRNMYQGRTFDMNSRTTNRGFDATMVTLSLGVSYYIGKKEKHADWTPTSVSAYDNLAEKELEARIKQLEANLDKLDSLAYKKALEAKQNEENERKEAEQNDLESKETERLAEDRKVKKDEDKPAIEKPAIEKPLEKPLDKSQIAKDLDKVKQASKTPLEQKSVASFGFDSPNMVTTDEKAVKEILSYLKADNKNLVEIHGFSSSEGNLNYNIELSRQRAESFKSYLLQRGAEANKLKVVARGIEDPIADNNTAQGRKKNRRVEVRLK